LILVIALADGVPVKPHSLLLKVAFRNASKNPVRLLKYFDDTPNLPIWFQLHITSLEGTPVLGIQGGGKISIRDPLDYVVIQPGKTFSVEMDVAKFVTGLHRGTYKVSMTYRNQYGEDCFRGELKSNTLEITVPRDGNEP
jgi:hypothetical protein